MAGSENPILQVVAPVGPSQAPEPTPVPGGMGTATRLSLQAGCVQASDASEDVSTATHRDSRGNILREPKGIMGKCRLVLNCLKTLEQWSSPPSFEFEVVCPLEVG